MEKQSAPRVHIPQNAGIPTHTPDGKAFIGAKSKEFQQMAGAPPPEKMAIPEEPPKKEEPKEEKNLCRGCGSDIEKECNYCPFCGLEQETGNASKGLGIKLSDEELSEYFFQGYLVKEISLVRDKKAIFKTLLPFEATEVEKKVMDVLKDGDATQRQWQNIVALVNLSYGWIKFDNQSLGETPPERYKRLDTTIGTHLIDIASRKWTLFNRSVQQMLEDPDALKN